MKRIAFSLWLAAWSCVALADAAVPEVALPSKYRSFLQQHCFECHDASTQEGKVNLEALAFRIETVEQAELWQKVLNALNAGEMPPEDSAQPGKDEKADFLDALAQTMVAARRALSDSGGKITMRRLNRREYRNTIAHLTGVQLDVDSLPDDGGAGTLDTVGAAQFISSDQFEQYLKLGRRAIDEAFERRADRPARPRVFRVEPETTVNARSRNDMRKLEEAHQRYQLWRAEVEKVAAAPENKQVIDQLRKKFPDIDKGSRFRLYQNANLLHGLPDAKQYGFKDANDAEFSFRGGYGRKYAYLKHYAELPHSDRGTYLKLTWGIQRIDVTPKPKTLPPGTYTLRVRAGVVDGSPAYRHFIEIGHPQRVNQVPAGFASMPISSHHVTGTVDAPEVIETQVHVGSLTPREFGIQERQPSNGKSLRDSYNRDKRTNGYGTPPAVWIDWIELVGPLPEEGAPAPLQVMLDKYTPGPEDGQEDNARRLLAEFAHAALREAKPDATFIDKLVALFEGRRQAGESFEVAIRTPLSVILASPGFLYFNEPGGESGKRQIDDRELAVRLAYFLWSAPPDQQLLALAKRQTLHRPAVLRKQVDRMIADSRSDAFVSGFVHQWLQMERLDFFQFDVARHREFDENTRAAAREEVYQSFAHLLRDREAGRLGKLLKADYIMINGLLATYYGIEGVSGDAFRQVSVPADLPRGGLLGMAAIHAMGSDGVVSSPVERGAWILRYLLNDPPPPAPPNVPQISRLESEVLTTRERLAAHQEEAQCASCHRKIDPIGFGLENFDAAGKWRTENRYQLTNGRGRPIGKSKTWTVDASGAFHQGPAFRDYFELRDLIAEREAAFARGFSERLIEYALGRPYGFTDQELAAGMVRAAKKQQFAMSAFIHSLVQSEAFRNK